MTRVLKKLSSRSFAVDTRRERPQNRMLPLPKTLSRHPHDAQGSFIFLNSFTYSSDRRFTFTPDSGYLDFIVERGEPAERFVCGVVRETAFSAQRDPTAC